MFAATRELVKRARTLRKLSPNAQLLYHTLLVLNNLAYWAHSFEVSDSELREITHLSKDSLTKAKRVLKNLGYIDFAGTPSQFHIPSILPGQKAGYTPREEERSSSLPSSPGPPTPNSTPKEEETYCNTRKHRARGGEASDRSNGRDGVGGGDGSDRVDGRSDEGNGSNGSEKHERADERVLVTPQIIAQIRRAFSQKRNESAK